MDHAFLIKKACTLLGSSNQEKEGYIIKKITSDYGKEEHLGVRLARPNA